MLHKTSPMAQRMILLFSLCAVLHGDVSQPHSIQKCCQDGRARGLEGHDCTILPFVPTHICSIVQEQCCRSVVRDRLCNRGIKMAREQGACERPFFHGDPWETKISKMCCDCCELGLTAASAGLSRELHGLLLPRQCSYAAKTCCGNNTTEDSKPSAAVTQKPEVVTTKPPDETNPCKNSRCSQLCASDGKCGCRDGFQLQQDGVSCEDINECLTNSHNCIPGQVCINTEGSFRCQRKTSCGTGYELTDNNVCKDIDECALGTHDCGPDFVCTNTEGSFRCRPKDTCGDGYIQDAVGSCIDINECVVHHNPCLPGQTCINTVGSYTCRSNTVTCGRGYHLNEDGSRCEDVDECRTGNVCGVHGCVNLLGSYRCECNAGFTFNSITKLCEDINECTHYPGRLCAHKCENTEGSYKCSCTSGFKLGIDGRSCEDVNECEANPCSQECANVYGSYQCYCRRGYQLSDIDGNTCEDIDECATGGHSCSYHCFNTPGSFNCSCPSSGYTLAHDLRTCQDVDECAAGTHTCSVSQSCFNVLGGYRCLSFECPPNYRQAVKGRCERPTCEFTRDPASCFSLPLRISFYNVSFPTNTHVPADVFRMGPSNSVPGDQMRLDIVSGDEDGYFTVQRQAHGGVVSLRRVLTEPRDFFLTLEMRLIRYGTTHLYTAKIAVSRADASATLRCIKSCQSYDMNCVHHPVNLVTHTAISLPTFRDSTEPEEIVLLRTTVPADPAPSPDATDVFFVVLGAENQILFDVVRRTYYGMIMGVVRQVKPLVGPRDLVLEVSMNYVKSGVLTQRSVIMVHVFVSEFSF